MGQIGDILIDREHSAVIAAVISVRGFLGLGEKQIAIPTNQRFTINMSKEDLRNTLTFILAKHE